MKLSTLAFSALTFIGLAVAQGDTTIVHTQTEIGPTTAPHARLLPMLLARRDKQPELSTTAPPGVPYTTGSTTTMASTSTPTSTASYTSPTSSEIGIPCGELFPCPGKTTASTSTSTSTFTASYTSPTSSEIGIPCGELFPCPGKTTVFGPEATRSPLAHSASQSRGSSEHGSPSSSLPHAPTGRPCPSGVIGACSVAVPQKHSTMVTVGR